MVKHQREFKQIFNRRTVLEINTIKRIYGNFSENWYLENKKCPEKHDWDV